MLEAFDTLFDKCDHEASARSSRGGIAIQRSADLNDSAFLADEHTIVLAANLDRPSQQWRRESLTLTTFKHRYQTDRRSGFALSEGRNDMRSILLNGDTSHLSATSSRPQS